MSPIEIPKGTRYLSPVPRNFFTASLDRVCSSVLGACVDLESEEADTDEGPPGDIKESD